MADTHDTVLQKIKALLRLAEDSRSRGSLHEAEAAAAIANEMVQRFRLDMATIEAATDEAEREYEPITEEDNEMFGGRTVTWRGSLSSVLCREYGCSSYYRHVWIKEQKRGVVYDTIIGRKSDIEIVKYMHAWLRLEVTKLADAYIAMEYPFGGRGGRVKAARNAFCLGAVSGIEEALKKSHVAAETVHEQTAGPLAHKAGAMVLVSREAELKTYMKKLKLTSGRSATVSDGGAYSAGRAAGARIQVNQRGLGAGRTKVLGGGS